MSNSHNACTVEFFKHKNSYKEMASFQILSTKTFISAYSAFKRIPSSKLLVARISTTASAGEREMAGSPVVRLPKKTSELSTMSSLMIATITSLVLVELSNVTRWLDTAVKSAGAEEVAFPSVVEKNTTASLSNVPSKTLMVSVTVP